MFDIRTEGSVVSGAVKMLSLGNLPLRRVAEWKKTFTERKNEKKTVSTSQTVKTLVRIAERKRYVERVSKLQRGHCGVLFCDHEGANMPNSGEGLGGDLLNSDDNGNKRGLGMSRRVEKDMYRCTVCNSEGRSRRGQKLPNLLW